MVNDGLTVLCGAAAVIGLLHTLLGPDHYLPFVAMARAGKWSLAKTVIVTALCGVGHVLGSVALGLIGIASGMAIFKLEEIESIRGDVAGWLLLSFGLAYAVWGIRRAIRFHAHSHAHIHLDGKSHSHQHDHHHNHVHVHHAAVAGADPDREARSVSPWVLFTIFLLGPCEPLIPILMYPAAQKSMWGVLLVTAVFGVTTLATMITIVTLGCVGIGASPFARLERYGHALAGLALLASGAAIMAGF